MNRSGELNRFKRKKKRSLVQQVKKRFMKSESFSRGTRLETEEYNYFMRVFELEQNFEGRFEEKVLFANNALKQAEGREIDCSFNQLVSHIIENLLPFASNDVLNKFFEAFSNDLRPICVHQFASHVLRTLMVIASEHSLLEGEDVDSEHAAQCKAWLLKVCGFLHNNLEEFMWDKYASPVLRTAIFCLAGMPQLSKEHKVNKSEKKFTAEIDKHLQKPVATNTQVPEEYLSLMELFFERVSTWPQFKESVCDSLSSRYLQCLIKALKATRPKTYSRLSKKIRKECFPKTTDENDSVMYSNIALPVLELIVKTSSQKIRRKIYVTLFANRLLKMSTAEIGSLTVQNFITHCDDPKIISNMVSILEPNFKDLLIERSRGVLVALGGACQKVGVAQSKYLKALLKALKCHDEVDRWLVASILNLTPLPHDSPLNETQWGARLVQYLLEFKKPIKIVKSLLSYEPRQLAELLCSQYSSHITKAFHKSSSIGENNKQKLAKKLEGNFLLLAESKFGSWSFDDIWSAGDLDTKLMIVKDIANHSSEIMKTRNGRFVAKKTFLLVFKNQGVKKWKQSVQNFKTVKRY